METQGNRISCKLHLLEGQKDRTVAVNVTVTEAERLGILGRELNGVEDLKIAE